MKKILPLIIGLVVLVGGIIAFTKIKSKPATEEQTTQKKRIEQPTNVIAVEERPYIKISPLGDGHNLNITIDEVKKDATEIEYELEYQAGTLLQGAFGQFSLSSLPATEKVLLGSCSAGGACSFHEDVQGGTLLTRFDGEEPYALKSRWKYIDNSAGETAFSSQDAKFQLESQDLKKNRLLVIFNTSGYPTGPKTNNSLVSEIYSLTGSSNLDGEAELTIRAEEEGNLMIIGYDGQEWHSFETEVDGKMTNATVDLMELYMVIKINE